MNRVEIRAWVVVLDEAARTAANLCTRGCYQRSLLLGSESLSGSTLRGKAARYRGRYAMSRDRLLARMTAAGVPWHEARGPHNRRVLVLGCTK